MDICVWDKCNNRCLMCTNPDRPWPNWDGSFDYSFPAIKKRLEKIHKSISEDDSIYLSGGEPSLHPNFLDILKYLKKEFPAQRVKLLTNGRMMSYEKFTQKVMAINDNFEIDLSIYGGDAATHDKVTRSKGSFIQTLKGLENIITLKQPNQLIGTRFVITNLSYKHIEKFLSMIKNQYAQIDRVILIFWEIEHQAIKNFSDVKIDYQSVTEELNKASNFLTAFNELRLYHFPLCVVSSKLWPNIWRTLDKKDVKFLPACNQCQYKKHCLGIPISYLENMGDKKFLPITKKYKIKTSSDKFKPINEIK